MRRGTPRRWATEVAAMASVGDYGTEDEGNRPREPYGPVGRRGNHADGHQNEADRQKRDRAQVGAEISPGGQDRRDVKERRQEQEEHDLRVELYPRQSRHEAERQPAKDKQDRVRDADPVGEGREHGYRDEQDEDRLYLRHRSSSPSLPHRRKSRAQANLSGIIWVISASSCNSENSLCTSSLAMSHPSRSRSSISRVTTYR